MHTPRALLSLVLAASLAAACSTPSPTPDASDNDAASQPDATMPQDASTMEDSTAQPDVTVQPDVTSQPDTATPDGSSTPDSSSMGDASGDACVPPAGVAANLMGPGACSTLDFGRPAVAAMTVPAAITFTGGAIPQGIYDAVSYSRTVGTLESSYRATLVVGAENRYTEIRQINTSSTTMGPVTRRSGTLMPSGMTLGRLVTCTDGDAGMDTMSASYAVETRCDGVYIHFGTTNLWFTYRRRTP